MFRLMSSGYVCIVLCGLVSCYTPPPYEDDYKPSNDEIVMLGPDDSQRSIDVRRGEEIGLAAYYSDDLHGLKTANGDYYDRNELTGAHRSLPFGTRCRITNLENGKTVEVRINDRYYNDDGRIIDLSYAAMERLGGIHQGIVRVRIEVLQ